MNDDTAFVRPRPWHLAPRSGTGRAISFALVGLLVAAIAYFLYRGPIRAWQHTVDLNTFYSASRAWLDGSDPYDALNLSTIFHSAGGLVSPALSINPPQTFVLMAPLSVLPWPVAEGGWTILNVILVVVCLWLAMSLAQISVREPRGLLFLSFAIALAPFHTSISQGQLTIAVTALVLGILWAQLHGHPVLGGVFLAVAISLKPQMAVLFLALLLFRHQWRALIAALGVLAAVTAVGLARMAIAGVDWLPTLEANLTTLTQGGSLDPAAANAYLMINLQILLHLLLVDQTQTILNIVTYTTVAAAGALFLLALRRRSDQEAQLLLFAGFAVLNLLFVYNRIYGATLLILPLAWAWSPRRPARSRAEAVVVVSATIVFLIPGAAALASVSLPAAIQFINTTDWWPYLLLHEIFALIAILIALLLAARVARVPPALAGDVSPPG